MASLHAGGCGVEQDYAESARWYLLAADQGSGEAQARLGDMYANGEGGVQRDPVEADKWYQRAVEPGTYHSTKVAGVVVFSGRHVLFHLFVLARLYQDGIGIPQNDVAAYRWLDIRKPPAVRRVWHYDFGGHAAGARRSGEENDKRAGG